MSADPSPPADDYRRRVKNGCLLAIGALIALVVIGSVMDGGGGQEDEILRLVGQRAACLSHLPIDDVAMVASSESTDDLAVVKAFTKNALRGTETEYRFGVPLAADGTPRGTVLPGNEAARNCLT